MTYGPKRPFFATIALPEAGSMPDRPLLDGRLGQQFTGEVERQGVRRQVGIDVGSAPLGILDIAVP